MYGYAYNARMQNLTRRGTRHEQSLPTTDTNSEKSGNSRNTAIRGPIIISVIIIVLVIVLIIFRSFSGLHESENIEIISKNSKQSAEMISPTVPTASIVHKLTIHSLYKIQPLEGNEQSERKNMVIEPGRFQEYDPFLLLFEDWIGPN